MSKSNYSDEKNPHSNKIQDGWIVNQRHDDYKAGYLQGERDKADELVRLCQIRAENNETDGDNGYRGDDKTTKNPEKQPKERVD